MKEEKREKERGEWRVETGEVGGGGTRERQGEGDNKTTNFKNKKRFIKHNTTTRLY